MNRRQAALTLTLSGLAAAASGCRPRAGNPMPVPAEPASAPPASPPPFLEGQDLTPVQVEPGLEIRTIAGLRPWRRSGFVVRRDDTEGKILVHNYGHGGGGVTLSWGCAHLAIRLAGSVAGRACAVIGGGVMGLSTARLLQRQGASVTLYTQALPPDTTSNVAGAQWWPVSLYENEHRTEAFSAQFIEAARFSHQYFQPLAGPRWGVSWLPNYYLSEGAPLNGWMGGPQGVLHSLQIGFRDFGPGEHLFPARHVRRFHSMFIEPGIYLETLLGDVLGAGAKIEIRHFAQASEILQLPQPVLFNCTGLGARALFGDGELHPVKGQLSLLLPQPAVRYNLITDTHYMFPRSSGIVLGGSYQHGNWDLNPDPAIRDRILQGHQTLFNAMRTLQQEHQAKMLKS